MANGGMNLGKFIGNLKLQTVGRVKAARLSKIDFGIFKVAFMIAALDGEITEAEYKALDALVRKCRGYSKEVADRAQTEAMRSAGYLLLLGRHSSDSEVVQAFVSEALAALPDGFGQLSVAEVRRAVVLWIAMGMSDGDYSGREKKCIEALRRVFAEDQVISQMASDSCVRMSPVSPVFVSSGFIRNAEALVAQYGDEATAAKALEQLIAGE